MRADVGFPVINADAIDRPWYLRIAERRDRVVAHRAVEDISEGDYRTAEARERHPQPTAFARIVRGNPGVRNRGSVIIRPGKCKGGTSIGLVSRFGGSAIALVEPRCKQRSIRIECDGLEA